MSSMATIYVAQENVVSTFEIGIFENTKCDGLVGFPNQIAICLHQQ